MTLHKYKASDFTLVHNRFLDEYMMDANGEFVKVYLYLLRCSSAERELSLSSIADALNYTEGDVKRALTYWEKQHLLRLAYSKDGALSDIILSDGMPAAPKETKNRLEDYASHMADMCQRISAAPEKITISADRKKQLAAMEEVQQIIFVAEQYLGKKLSSTEVTNILYFYDELHFSEDLIDYLLGYCVSKGKRSINYIRAVALEWAARGIATVEEARRDTNLYNKDFYSVLHAFGIKDRGPAQAETELMTRWFSQLGFSLDIVLEACRRTINRTHTPNFQYADKILESWKASGVKCFGDIAALDKPAAPAPNEARASSQPNNKFNNFKQRDYDYDQLEQQLLDC